MAYPVRSVDGAGIARWHCIRLCWCEFCHACSRGPECVFLLQGCNLHRHRSSCPQRRWHKQYRPFLRLSTRCVSAMGIPMASGAGNFLRRAGNFHFLSPLSRPMPMACSTQSALGVCMTRTESVQQVAGRQIPNVGWPNILYSQHSRSAALAADDLR